MKWMTTTITLLPTITKLVELAESLFTDKPKSGAQKKAFVQLAVNDIIHGAMDVTTGGANNTFKKLDVAVPKLIDIIADVKYPHKTSNIVTDEIQYRR